MSAPMFEPPPDVYAMLAAKFSQPHFLLLREVRDATGFDANRSADAMAVGLYRSHGKAVWGFEFKVSRQDWLRELKQPGKAEAILRFCDHWALVIPDISIVKMDEVPEPWGVFAPKGKRLHCYKVAPKLEALPPNRTFLTALIKAVFDLNNKPAQEVANEAFTRGRREGYEAGKKSVPGSLAEYEKLKASVELFESVSGIRIDTYSAEYGRRIAKAVNAVVFRYGDVQHTRERIARLASEVKSIAQGLETNARELGAEMDAQPVIQYPGGAA